MWRRLDRWKTVTGFRITEEPMLYGLVIRERGELIEFVSFAEARRRQKPAMRMAKVVLGDCVGDPRRHCVDRREPPLPKGVTPDDPRRR